MGGDPNIAVVDLVAKALGPLCDELMLVGGCAVGLLMTDAARAPVRQTADVDLVAQVVSIADYYHSLLPRLKERGFVESSSAEHMGRWTRGSLLLDVMPSTDVLGHSVNRWYAEGFRHAKRVTLPSKVELNLISAPLFIATKLDAFHGRARGDYFHHDMEDILNIVDGRAELGDELGEVGGGVVQYVEEEFRTFLSDEGFVDAIDWQFPDGRSRVVIARIQEIAGVRSA